MHFYQKKKFLFPAYKVSIKVLTINTIKSIIKKVKISSRDVFISVASISFDMFIMDMWLTFFVGGTLIIPKEEEIRNTKRIISYINNHKVSVLEAVPTY